MLFLFTIVLPGKPAAAQEEKVTVSLPDFKVQLNGLEIDNRYAQYPLLVYNNITYYPMTYYGSRYLGVETTWSEEGGLGVHQNGVRWNWHAYKRYLPNIKSGIATINEGNVRVNNQLIDNSKEDYPLLSFRNVAYFPLTWRFAVDEFGWTYQYSPQDGLSINSPGAIAANEITLPIKKYDNGAGAFVKAGVYYYYEGERGSIWRAAVAAPEQTKKVYEVPIQDRTADGAARYGYPQLKVENGIVLLQYRQADGAVCYVQLFSDGSAEEIYQGYGSLHCYEDLFVLNDKNIADDAGVLKIRAAQGGAFQQVGDAAYYSSQDRVCRAGTELLTIGGLGDKTEAKSAGIVAVNYKTGAVRQVTKKPVQDFTVDDGQIYFLDDAQQLHRISVKGGTGTRLSSKAVSQFAVLNSTVCYAAAGDNGLYVLGGRECLNPGGIVADMDVQEDFFVINFSDAGSSAYKAMILSRKGKVLFKTTEHTASMIIENGKVSFVKLQD